MSNKEEGVCFLVFSDDFGEHPSSCQHLFHHISKNHQVLWVNTVGMRSPKLTRRDILKGLNKTKKMISSLFSKGDSPFQSDNINVCQPPMLPFLNIPMIRSLNKISVVHQVRKKLRSLKMDSPINVITAPNACDYINYFGESKIVYYCVDDFPEWPGLEKELVCQMEDYLIANADVFVATSQDLCKKIETRGKNVNLLTHGVDIDFFAALQVEEHPSFETIPGPRVGYFGLFDDRSNKELLIETAKLMPDISFVITGGLETDTTKLKQTGNIYFTGSVPYVELPKIAKGFDICMLPYKINKLTNAIQPLKFKEYLATGKPIVSTPIKEALDLTEYIEVADSAKEWVDCIKSNLDGLSLLAKEKRSEFIQEHSWEKKSEQFLKYIVE